MDAFASFQKKNTAKKKEKMTVGVAVLTASTLLVKVLGLIFKIPLINLLGAEGMGYFNAAFEVYSLFFIVSSSGLPSAECLLISENIALEQGEQTKRIYRVCFALFLVLGIASALGMALFSGWFSRFIGNEKARLCLIAISPAVAFSCFSGAVKGLFQGYKDMTPTAVSQCIEALGKTLFGCGFAFAAVQKGTSVEVAAAMGVLGLCAGSLFSFLYLCRKKTRFFTRIRDGAARHKSGGENAKGILKKMWVLAFPMTLGTLLSGLMRSLDTFFILRRLSDIGYDSQVVATMYGSFSTLVLPIYNLPGAFMACIVSSMMPGLAGAYSSGDKTEEEKCTVLSFCLCAAVAIPCALGFAFFAKPALSFLFHGQEEAICISAPLLSLLSFSVVPSCLLYVIGGILQAQKKPILPMVAMGVGCLVKCLTEWTLLGISSVGLKGAVISTWICNLVTLGFEMCFLYKNHFEYARRILSIFLKLLLFGTVAVGFSALCFLGVSRTGMKSSFCFLLSMGVCAIIYGIMLLLSGEGDSLGLKKGKAEENAFFGGKRKYAGSSYGGKTS